MPRILTIDNEPNDIAALIELFSRYNAFAELDGLEIIDHNEIFNPEACLKALKQAYLPPPKKESRPYDAIICDLHLGNFQGDDIIHLLKGAYILPEKNLQKFDTLIEKYFKTEIQRVQLARKIGHIDPAIIIFSGRNCRDLAQHLGVESVQKRRDSDDCCEQHVLNILVERGVLDEGITRKTLEGIIDYKETHGFSEGQIYNGERY